MLKKLTIENFDKETKCVKLVLNQKMYSLQTLYAASYVFLDKAYILFDQGKGQEIVVYMFSKGKGCLRTLALEFYNELINFENLFFLRI